MLDLRLLRSDVPGWLAAGVLVLSIALAGVTLLLMLRPHPSARSTEEHPGSSPRGRVDPMLAVSALSVIVLGVVVWLLR